MEDLYYWDCHLGNERQKQNEKWKRKNIRLCSWNRE